MAHVGVKRLDLNHVESEPNDAHGKKLAGTHGRAVGNVTDPVTLELIIVR